MTRHHFRQIAQAFANSRPAQGTSGYDQWLRDVASVALALRGLAPSFNAARFGAACADERKDFDIAPPMGS